MPRLVLILAMLLAPGVALAANGATCRITPPSTVEAGSTPDNTATSCIDVCDRVDQDGTLECGPIWLPIQNADSTNFEVIADAGDCVFDTLDVIIVSSGTADPDDFHKKIYGTLDDDAGCGLSGTSPCAGVDIPYPVAGYVFIDSGASTIGGGSCATFKVRMTQHKVP